MPDKVLVTGASGFVGSAVVRALLSRGYDVRALVRPTSPRRNLEGLKVEIAQGDLLDTASLATALDGCDTLIHTAADYRLWVRGDDAMMRVNVEGTRLLMQAALHHRLRRVVHTSSVATLGLAPRCSLADETTPSCLADMTGPYKRSKFLAEEMVRQMVAERGLPAVIVNPSVPVGPGDIRPTPTGRVIIEAAAGRMKASVRTGLNLVHVDDVALGHVLALERGELGERYILGGDNLLLEVLLAKIAAEVGRRPPRLSLPIAAVMPVALAAEGWGRLTGREPFVTLDGVRMARHVMFFTSARAERELGYRHRPAGQAIATAIAWFRDEGRLP